MTVEAEINALASHVAKQAAEEGDNAPSFGDKVEALKVLTAYYAAIKKRAPNVEDEDDTPNFGNFAKGLQELKNGETAVRNSRGRRNT